MTKFPKPTPAQARILRALAAEPDEKGWYVPGLSLNIREKDGVEYITNVIGRNLGGLRCNLSTGKVLHDRGWLVRNNPEAEYLGGTYSISDEGRAVLEGLTDKDFESPARKKPEFTTKDIGEALVKKYDGVNNRQRGRTAQKWIYFFEVPSRAYYGSSRIDFWAMACWNSLQYQSVSYEIKISRGDFLNEIKKPEKRKFGMALSNYFYFVTGPALLSIDEIPEGCGLMELWEDGDLHIIKKAPKRKREFQATWDLVATVGRRALAAWQDWGFVQDGDKVLDPGLTLAEMTTIENALREYEPGWEEYPPDMGLSKKEVDAAIEAIGRLRNTQ